MVRTTNDDMVNLGIEMFVELPFEYDEGKDTDRNIELFFNKSTMIYTGIDIVTNESWQWKATKNPLTLTLNEQVEVFQKRFPNYPQLLGTRNYRDPWVVGYGVDLMNPTKVW